MKKKVETQKGSPPPTAEFFRSIAYRSAPVVFNITTEDLRLAVECEDAWDDLGKIIRWLREEKLKEKRAAPEGGPT